MFPANSFKCLSFMTAAKRGDGVMIFWAILLIVVDGFWEGGIFLFQVFFNIDRFPSYSRS